MDHRILQEVYSLVPPKGGFQVGDVVKSWHICELGCSHLLLAVVTENGWYAMVGESTDVREDENYFAWVLTFGRRLKRINAIKYFPVLEDREYDEAPI